MCNRMNVNNEIEYNYCHKNNCVIVTSIRYDCTRCFTRDILYTNESHATVILIYILTLTHIPSLSKYLYFIYTFPSIVLQYYVASSSLPY